MDSHLPIQRRNRFVDYFFFSNLFYGVCAVALTIEATLQQRIPLNGGLYFVVIFLTTVLYYNYPYVRSGFPRCTNPRTNWYAKNYPLLFISQVFTTLLLFSCFGIFLLLNPQLFSGIHWREWIVLLIFPLAGMLYYGSSRLPGKYNLRKTGWLKPFVIGFTWAGWVTIYPVLFQSISNDSGFELTEVGFLLFLKNWMFIAVLCIMFDIKDYAPDYLDRLRTFVVRVGLRKTIFRILFPLVAAGLIAFLWYATSHGFHPGKVVLNIIPFILLFAVAWELRRRRSALYYLGVVDGLMLAKAVCGTVAILYF